MKKKNIFKILSCTKIRYSNRQQYCISLILDFLKRHFNTMDHFQATAVQMHLPMSISAWQVFHCFAIQMKR